MSPSEGLAVSLPGSGPAGGEAASSLSAAWLRDALAAERASVTVFLEKRHQELLSELVSVREEGCERRRDLDVGAKPEIVVARSLSPATPQELFEQAGPDFQPPTTATTSPRRCLTKDSHAVVDSDIPARQESGYECGCSETSPAGPGQTELRMSRQASVKLSQVKKSLGVIPVGEDDKVVSWSYRLASHPAFELVVAAVIMLNVCVMAVEIQYQGIDLGFELGYRGFGASAPSAWPGASSVFEVFEYLFGVMYCAELILKVHAFRRAWLHDPWNYFDVIIVGFWLLEIPFKALDVLPTNATLLRAARLFKLLRLVKIIKTLQGFDSLYLLITTLRGSGQILGWSCALLVIVQMLIAFVMFMLLNEMYFNNDHYPIEEQLAMFQYFGSFSRAMLSMFELTLANWPPLCRLLVENVSEWFMLFFIAHKLTIGFAVIGVINGVFMQETFRVASSDDSIMMRQRERDVRVYGEKLNRLFSATDEDCNGSIDIDEFGEVMQDPEINSWMTSLELPVRDPHNLFQLLDVNGSGSLTAEELIRGMLRLRGTAKTVDLISLKKQLDDMQVSLSRARNMRSVCDLDHLSGTPQWNR